jgi:hypothetical protein
MIVAIIELDRREFLQKDLPFVCLKCGRPADLWMSKRFDWMSRGAAVANAFGPANLPPKLIEVRLPLCWTHRRHWLWRAIFAWAGGVTLLACFGLGIAMIEDRTLFMEYPIVRQSVEVGFGMSCIGLPLWVVSMLVIQTTAIRLNAITDKSITLKGVSPKFIERLEEYRRTPAADRNTVRQSRLAGPEARP